MSGNLYRLTKSQTGERMSGEFHRAVSYYVGFMSSKSSLFTTGCGIDFGDPANSTLAHFVMSKLVASWLIEILNTLG